jgi:hypothetical protein
MKFRDGSSSLYLDLFIFRPVSNQTCFVFKFAGPLLPTLSVWSPQSASPKHGNLPNT